MGPNASNSNILKYKGHVWGLSQQTKGPDEFSWNLPICEPSNLTGHTEYKKPSMPKLLGLALRVWSDQIWNNEVHTPDIYLIQ